MSLRFLQLSDLDLGARPAYLGAGAEARSQELLETFRDAISFALDPENRIHGVLVAGNLFHRHRPAPETWAFVRGLFGRLVAGGKTVCIVPGSRDSAVYKDSVLRTERLPGVDILSATTAGAPLVKVIDGQTVHFYSVAPHPGTEFVFEGFSRTDDEGFHIGLLNGVVPEHPEWFVRSRDLIIEPGVLSESGLDYVALGGYHTQTPLHLEGTTAAYAGTLEGRDFVEGDLGKKSLLVVDLSDEGVRFEQHPISRKTLADVTIDLAAEGIVNADGLLAAIVARGSKELICRVTVKGPLEFLCDFARTSNEAADHFAYLELRDQTDLLGSALLRHIENEGTIRGFFVRRMLRRIGDLTERSQSADGDSPAHRDLEVARRALKIGLEQFLDEEPAESLFSEDALVAKTKEPVTKANGKRQSQLQHREEVLSRVHRDENAEGGAQ